MKIYINNEQDIPIMENIEEIAIEIAELALEKENMSNRYEISISFVDNNRIRELNRDFRNIDSITDVLSFPLLDEDSIVFEDLEPMLGDIVISVEKAKEQAEEFNHSLEREIVYLIVHSVFHLLGYDHMDENQKNIMRNKEKEIIREIKIFRNK